MEVGRRQRRIGDDQDPFLELARQDTLSISRKLYPEASYDRCPEFASAVFRKGKWYIEREEPDAFHKLGVGYWSSFTLQSRFNHMADKYNARLKLPPAFTAAPNGPQSNFGFYIRHGDSRLSFFNFHSTYAARHFLDATIAGKKFKWLNDDEIFIEEIGVRIRGECPGQLDKALEHKMSETELEWELPEPYRTYARILSGEARARMQEAPLAHRVPHTATRKTRKERVTPTQSTRKESGLTSIADIAQRLGKSPRECRVVLRSLKVEKPAHGNWAWPPSEAEAIQARIAKAIR